MSLRMRRVHPLAFEEGVRKLEEGFIATHDNAVFLAERESGVLCSLGEDGGLMNVVLTGEEYPRTGPGMLPVLGGEHISSMGSPVDVLLWLKEAEVRQALNFLEGVNLEEIFELRRSSLANLLDDLADDITQNFQQMLRFYRLAVQEDQAVVKRVYAP